jgi:hypothetical protein
LLVAAVIALGDALGFGLSIGLIYGPVAWLTIALTIVLIYGLISLALSSQMEDIRPTEHLSWTWRSLRRGLFNSRHLRITVLLTCITTIFAGLRQQGLSQGLGLGLSVGLSYWSVLGLFQGVAQERINNQDRRVANQGIHRSLRNSMIMGIIGGTIIGIIGILKYWLLLGLNNVLSPGPKIKLISGLSSGPKIELISEPSAILSYGLLLGLSGALLIYMLTGGLAVLRHYTIRFLLWRSRAFPGSAPQFLDDATARFLLRRVGGGYSFTHRLLLDHFADEETRSNLRTE